MYGWITICDRFEAIKPGIRKSNPYNLEACQWAWKCEWKWMVVSRITWTWRVLREKWDASSDIVPVQHLFCALCSFVSIFLFPLFLSPSFLFCSCLRQIWVVTMQFHVPQSRWFCNSLHELQCVGCRVHVLKINAIIRLVSPSFEYIDLNCKTWNNPA